MCGLAGWLGEPTVTDRVRLARARTLEGLLVANASRGTDASGVGMITADGLPCLYKRAVNSYELVEDRDARSLMRMRNARAAIGHTRLGTHGKNTDRNAHPFIERTVTGAHNGIISNHLSLRDVNSLDRWKKAADVDSQQVLRTLAQARDLHPQHGFLSDYKSILPLVEGTLALVWVDKRDPGTVYLFRHDNPLSVAVVPRAEAAFWSSQQDHLAATVQSQYGSDWYNFTVNEDTVYRLYWRDDNLMYQKMTVDMPKTHRPSYTYGYDDEEEYRKRMYTPDRKPDAEMWWETCAVCYKTIDYAKDGDYGCWHEVEDPDGVLLCEKCDLWWQKDGSVDYPNLDEYLMIRQAIGVTGAPWVAGKEI